VKLLRRKRVDPVWAHRQRCIASQEWLERARLAAEEIATWPPPLDCWRALWEEPAALVTLPGWDPMLHATRSVRLADPLPQPRMVRGFTPDDANSNPYIRGLRVRRRR